MNQRERALVRALQSSQAMSEYAVAGPTPATADRTTEARPVMTPGRTVLAEPAAAPATTRGIDIAPDARDHGTPPALGAELDVELRTLIAHVQHNLALHGTASRQPERDAALDAIDTRVDVAFMHVPEAQQSVFLRELRATLGTTYAALAGVLADAAGSHGVRAATALGIARTRRTATPAPVQMFASGAARAADLVHEHAARGISGGGTQLPHLGAIQASFGHHEIGGVRAHVGGAAADASAAIGARAYASGDAVAFASAPDLRLAAHEAAHVVQQRGGVRLSSNLGAEGDAYEQHADAVADLVVRGESAEALLDQLAHRGSAGGSAVQRWAPHEAPIRLRAHELRDVLHERILALHRPALRRLRSPEQRAEELAQLQSALAALDEAGSTPPPALIDRLEREYDARMAVAHAEGGDPGADGAVVPRPTIAVGDAPARSASAPTAEELAEGRTMAQRLRATLELRAHDEERTEDEHQLARFGLQHLDALGDSPRPRDVRAIARSCGTDAEEVTLPGRLPHEDARPDQRGTIGASVGAGHLGGTVHHRDGDSDGASVHVQQTGGSVDLTHQGGHDDEEMQGGLGLSVQMGADGFQGADATLSAGYGPISGEVSGGFTYYADRPQRQRDGSYRVRWRIGLRGGRSGAVQLHETPGLVTASASTGESLEGTREGTDVFATLDAARVFQLGFRTLDPATIAERFERLATADLGTTSWWQTAPVGTERHVELQASVSRGLSATVLGLVNVGAGVAMHATPSGRVSKASATAVRVEEQIEVGGAIDPTIGAADLSVSGLGMLGIDHRASYTVTLAFEIDLASGQTAFARFLTYHLPITGDEPGVRMVSHEVEAQTGEGAGVHAGPVGRLDGGDSTATVTTTDHAADGTATEHVTHRATQESTGSAVTGAYSRRRLVVDAPEEDSSSYVATTDLHSTSGTESRELLGEATSTHGMSTDAATSSGNWIVREEITQQQMRDFHTRFIANRPAGGLTSYDRLYERLSHIPTDASGDAQRARVITTFLSTEGQRGLALIQSTGRFQPEISVRLFGRDGEDTNFLGTTELHALEARIAAYREAIAAGALDGLGARIAADIALLQPRFEAVSDERRYTDLPSELRAQICARYRSLLDQLLSVETSARGAGQDAIASRLGSDAQAGYRHVAPLRDEVAALHAETAAVRDSIIAHRRYYGQASDGVAHATLDADSAARCTAAWSSAELAFESAETARIDAESALANVGDDTPDLDAMRAYREATIDLERALGSYRTAHDEFAHLEAAYEHASTTGSPAVPDVHADPSAPQHADHASGARGTGASAATRDPDAAADPTPRTGVLLADRLAPHIHVPASGDLSTLAARPHVDSSPAAMPSGLVVQVRSAEAIVVTDSTVLAELGDRRLYTVTLEVLQIIPGATSFVVPRLRGGVAGNVSVANRVGEVFEAMVAI